MPQLICLIVPMSPTLSLSLPPLAVFELLNFVSKCLDSMVAYFLGDVLNLVYLVGTVIKLFYVLISSGLYRWGPF